MQVYFTTENVNYALKGKDEGKSKFIFFLLYMRYCV